MYSRGGGDFASTILDPDRRRRRALLSRDFLSSYGLNFWILATLLLSVLSTAVASALTWPLQVQADSNRRRIDGKMRVEKRSGVEIIVNREPS